MAQKDTFVPKSTVINDTNVAAGNHQYAFRGTEFLRWLMQVNIKNITVKIYASLWDTPGSYGWIDMTSYFTGSATITSNSMIMNTTLVHMPWWKVVYTRSKATNVVRIELMQYDREK